LSFSSIEKRAFEVATMKCLDLLQVTKSKAILIRRFRASLILLLLTGINRFGAQVARDENQAEPELISVFPLEGRQGANEEIEIRGKSRFVTAAGYSTRAACQNRQLD
jgi:hypothetical protein